MLDAAQRKFTVWPISPRQEYELALLWSRHGGRPQGSSRVRLHGLRSLIGLGSNSVAGSFPGHRLRGSGMEVRKGGEVGDRRAGSTGCMLE